MKQWIRNTIFILAGVLVGLTLVPALANSPMFTPSVDINLISEQSAIDSAMNYTDEIFELVSVALDSETSVFNIVLMNEFKEVDVEVNAVDGAVLTWKLTWIRNGDLISVEEAKAIALERAGEGFSVVSIKLDNDDDDAEYEVYLISEGFKIEVEIDAKSGEILKWEAEGLVSSNQLPEGLLSEDEVKRIVLERAGTSYIVVSVTLDDDDDDWEYDVILSSVETYIEAEVDAITGMIKEWEVENHVSNDSSQTSLNDSSSQTSFDDSNSSSSDSSSSVNQNVVISRERAIEIARTQIGDGPMLIKLELNYDDGLPYYDLEFKTESVEYEFEIDALSGNILDFEIED
jgi:uncharacterized membrane protein YkoI